MEAEQPIISRVMANVQCIFAAILAVILMVTLLQLQPFSTMGMGTKLIAIHYLFMLLPLLGLILASVGMWRGYRWCWWIAALIYSYYLMSHIIGALYEPFLTISTVAYSMLCMTCLIMLFRREVLNYFNLKMNRPLALVVLLLSAMAGYQLVNKTKDLLILFVDRFA